MSNDMPSIADVAAVLKPAPAAPEVTPPQAETPPATPEAAPEAAAPEAAPVVEPKAEAEPKKDPDSRKFAALARKEKEIRQREQMLAQKERETEDRQKAYEDRVKKAEERVEGILKGKRPLDVLKAAGMTYEEATKDVLGNYKPAEPDPLDVKLEPIQQKLNKIEELERKLVEWEQNLTQQQQQQNYKLMRDTIAETVNKNTERFEIVKSMGKEGVDLIEQVMIEYYTAHKELLTYEDACAQVEDWYEKDLLEKLSQTKKVQNRFKPSEPPKAPQAPQKPQETPAPKTLTADMTSGGDATIDIDKMSPSEAIAYLSKKIKYID